MPQGILILGLNGCGKTTVGRALAKRLGFFRMDAEDYYFPVPGDYSISRTEDEVHRLMETDAEKHGDFVLSCVRCNISDTLLEHIQLAVVLRAAPEVRAERIRQREIDRFGARVLPGGDMYEAQQAFHAFAARRTEEMVDRSLDRLACPMIEINAALPAEMIVGQICRQLQEQGDVSREIS